jgi:hypothetical protein
LGWRFEELIGVGSSGVSCDVYVLETVKADGDGLVSGYRLCRVAWSFDEKKEFCARTWFDRNPRAIMFCNSSLVEALDLEFFRRASRAFGGVRISNSWDFRGCNLAIRERCKAASTCASLSLATRFELEPS